MKLPRTTSCLSSWRGPLQQLPRLTWMALAVAAVPVQAQQAVTAFVNVSVIPMDRERVLAAQTVLVRGDRIIKVGLSGQVEVPKDAVRIDGKGKFLIPGLADMHVHLRHPEGASPPDQTLLLYVANGITTVRDMHSGGVDSPQLVLRRQVETGELLGPRIYTAGDPDASSPEAAAQSTEELKAAGHDFVKIYGWDSPVTDSVAATAARVGFRVVGHAPGDTKVQGAIDQHWASIEHLTGYAESIVGRYLPRTLLDSVKLRELAEMTRRAGIWNCPTLVVFPGVIPFTEEGNNYLPANASWKVNAENRYPANGQIVKALHDAGAGLIFGTDTWFPGFTARRELEALVEAGLTPYDALETATRNIAQFFGTLDSTGTVAEGKRADLVLLYGNPLQDVSYTAGPAGVMVGGRWLSRADIDARLDAVDTYVDQNTSRRWNLKAVRQLEWPSR